MQAVQGRIDGIDVHYAEHGRGAPLVALHGAGVDHREIEAAIEALLPDEGHRRIYPDLPGMGRTPADGMTGNDDVVALLSRFVDAVADGEPVLLLGHSYGALLARGVAARAPDRVLGLALLCPIGEDAGELPVPTVVREDPDAHGELDAADRAGFDEYFVVRTRATARRYRDHVVPGTQAVDEAALERIFARWDVDTGTEPPSVPVLIVAGRRDATAGYGGACALLERHPRAALAVIEDAGHALMHERPELLRPLLADWLART